MISNFLLLRALNQSLLNFVSCVNERSSEATRKLAEEVSLTLLKVMHDNSVCKMFDNNSNNINYETIDKLLKVITNEITSKDYLRIKTFE